MYGVLVVGPKRCGKDTVAEILSEETGAKYGGSTSVAIAEYIANADHRDIENVWAMKEAERDRWRMIGDILRRDDPAALARRMWNRGPIITGVRSNSEMECILNQGLASAIIWVERPNCADPTLDFDLSLLAKMIAWAPKLTPLHLVFNTGNIDVLRSRTIHVARAIPDLCDRSSRD